MIVRVSSRRRAAQAFALALAATGGYAFAADTTWSGPAGGTWNVAANWNNGIPTAGTNTFVDNGAVGNVNVFVTATTTTGTLSISAGDQVTINNNVFLSLNGTGTISALNNAGNLVIDSGAQASQFRFTTAIGSGVGTITGGGTIALNGALAAISGTDTTNVVNVNNYIHGQGNIGGDALRFTNMGTIVADINAGTLTLDPDNTGTQFTNTGTLRATNGATLSLSTGIYTNAGGGIEAQNNSTVFVQNLASVVGGTISTAGTGRVGVPAGQNGFFTDVVNNGAMFSENNSDFGVANSFVNNGTIQLNAGALATDLEIQNDVSLSGTGQLIMSGNLAGINGLDDRRLTNGVNHTIRGQGSIGQVGIWVTNNGTISADVAGATLTLSADGTALQNSFINTGKLIATNGGILVINGTEGDVTGTGGTIEAQNGSTVGFTASASILGGTMNTLGTGQMLVGTGQNAFFTDVVNNGLMISENNSDFGVATSFVNNGTIRLDAGALATDLEIQNDISLSGTGQLIMNGALAGINGVDDRRLSNGAGHTIRGQGSIGQVGIWLANSGTISADVSGATLTLSADGTAGQNAFINTGRLIATNGGILVLSGLEGGFTSAGGSIEAQDNSTVRFVANASIFGGTFTSSGTGTFRVNSGNAVLLNDIVLNGTLVAENNSNIQTFGPIVNNGTILIDSSGTNATLLNVRAPTLLDGTGQLILSGTLATAGGLNDQRLTNGTSHTIRGQGIVGGSEIWVTNNGTIVADVNGGSIVLAGDGTAGANAVINDGTLRATNGASIVFGPSEGGFSGLGNVIADANSNVRALGGVVVNQGPVTGSGTFSATAGSNFTATHFRIPNLIIDNATARVRAGGGTLGTSSAEVLTMTGTARLDLTDHDFALDSTSTTVDDMRLLIRTGYNNGAWTGQKITSSSAAAAAATADKTALGYAAATELFSVFPANFRGVSVDASTILVRYTLTGDANLDATVNITDFSRVASNFNKPGLWTGGDFNYDAMININDFSLLASNFNKTLAVGPRAAAVPEPTVAAALVLAGSCLARRRTR